jgi:hypothetical protein
MFLSRLNEISKPKAHPVEIDLGLGDGVETIYFRGLTFQERQDIFGARAKADGTGGLDAAILRENGRYLASELVSVSLVDENGKNVVRGEQVRRWPAELVDKISGAAMEVLTKAAQESAGNDSTASN